MEQFENVLVNVVDHAWNYIAYLLIAAGIYFGIRTIIVQIRLLPDMFRAVSERTQKPTEHGEKEGISAFKAFTISAASRVGTGNVAGVAVAISVGGPGAVFWMWMIALLGGATAFVESTLAQLWKVREGDGTYRGGPAYYITRGLNARPWAVIFALAITVTYGFVYNALQSNSIAESVANSLGNDTTSTRMIIGAILAGITGAIIFGGVRRIANFTQVIVPFMAGLYLIVGIIVLVMNIDKIPGMISDIVSYAFGIKEIAGAGLGTVFTQGMRRGLFSNEAGEGSAPNAAATASVSHPVKQGLVQTLGVYFDTILVCSITAFIILLSNPEYGTGTQGASMTQAALSSEVGAWGTHFITIVLFFLAFSSVIGNYYLAQANVEFFTQSKAVLNGFRVLVMLCVFVGTVFSVSVIWSLGDLFAAIMVVINVTAVLLMGGVAVKLLRNFSIQKAQGLDPVFHRDMLPELKNVECWDGSDPVTHRDGKIITQI